jgi:hypothetical protein
MLHDVIDRAHSVILESEGANEHLTLLNDLQSVSELCQHSIGTSHMGCAADEVILAIGDE